MSLNVLFDFVLFHSDITVCVCVLCYHTDDFPQTVNRYEETTFGGKNESKYGLYEY